MKLFDLAMLINDGRKGVNQMLQLQTIKNAVGFRKSAGDELALFKSTIDLLPEGK